MKCSLSDRLRLATPWRRRWRLARHVALNPVLRVVAQVVLFGLIWHHSQALDEGTTRVPEDSWQPLERVRNVTTSGKRGVGFIRKPLPLEDVLTVVAQSCVRG